MAKVIEHPDPLPRHYPWAQWLDGRTWELVRGVDFDCAPASFQRNAYRAARRRGGGLATRIVGDRVQLRFVAG